MIGCPSTQCDLTHPWPLPSRHTLTLSTPLLRHSLAGTQKPALAGFSLGAARTSAGGAKRKAGIPFTSVSCRYPRWIDLHTRKRNIQRTRKCNRLNAKVQNDPFYCIFIKFFLNRFESPSPSKRFSLLITERNIRHGVDGRRLSCKQE